VIACSTYVFLLLAYFLRDLPVTGEKIYARGRPKFKCANRKYCSVRCLSGPAPCAQHVDSEERRTAHVTSVEHARTTLI